MNFEPPEPNDYGHCLKCQKFVIEDEQTNGICIDCQSCGGAAFPQSGFDRWAPEGGMTLRDYFAAKCDIEVYAPVDSLYRKHGRNPTANELAAWIAEVRFIEADAMLEARK